MYEGLALAFQENDSLIINFYHLKGSFVCLFVCLFDCLHKNLTISLEYGKTQSTKVHLNNCLQLNTFNTELTIHT